jgi:hypothetical protein
MQQGPPAVAASTFAIFMLFLNLGVAFGQLAGGVITQIVGFSGLAVVMAMLLAAVLWPVNVLRDAVGATRGG